MERRQRFVQIVATLITAVLAALVVIGLMSTRAGKEHPVPAPAASPAAAHDYGAPAAGQDLLYVHDPHNTAWLTGLDWSGTPRATVKLDPSQTGALMAPDGQTFSLGMNAKGGTWQFLDHLGKPIPGPSNLAGALLPIWADDNRHVCATVLDQQSLAWSLYTQLPGEAPKRVLVLATDATLGETTVRVLACSFKNDVAIAERVTQSWPSELWFVKLSDGTVLSDKKRTGTDVASYVASPDGTLLAENSSKSAGETGGTAPFTTITKVADGSTLASIDPQMGVLAFSPDDAAMLVTMSPWVGNQPIHLAVINVQAWSVVWQDNTNPYFFGQFVGGPGQSGFAIAYPTTDVYPSPSIIIIVRPDGTFTTLDQTYIPAW